MLCESKYGWPEGKNTESERNKLVHVLREEAWIPKMDKPVMPEHGDEYEPARERQHAPEHDDRQRQDQSPTG
jgi:hypothetical protein